VDAGLDGVASPVAPADSPAASAEAQSQAERVAHYRLIIYRSALVLLFTIYPGLSTEIVKSFRYGSGRRPLSHSS
jgi:hypothetical protein